MVVQSEIMNQVSVFFKPANKWMMNSLRSNILWLIHLKYISKCLAEGWTTDSEQIAISRSDIIKARPYFWQNIKITLSQHHQINLQSWDKCVRHQFEPIFFYQPLSTSRLFAWEMKVYSQNKWKAHSSMKVLNMYGELSVCFGVKLKKRILNQRGEVCSSFPEWEVCMYPQQRKLCFVTHFIWCQTAQI